jgi:hypothetical protein
MEALVLPILFGTIVAVTIWSMIDNRAHDREGAKARKEAERRAMEERARGRRR